MDLDFLDTGHLPQAPEIEEAIIGSCMIEKESMYIALEMLNNNDFYYEKNQLLFSAIRELFEDGSEPTMLSLENLLRDRNQLDDIGGRGHIAECQRSVGSAAHIEQYCETIIQKRKRREAIEGFQKLSNIAADSSSDFNDVLAEADEVVYNLINDDTQSNTQVAETYIGDALEHIHSIQGSPNGITGIGTGLDIDKITAGWQKRDFILIAARPSMGKTALTLQCMKYAARNYGAAGLISLEMANIGLGTRLLYSEAKVNSQKARKGMLSQKELERVNEAAESLMDLGLILDDTTFVNPSKLRAKVRGMIHKHGIKILAIDYVQLLNSNRDNREQQVAEISRTCKAIAKEYDIPVIGLSQLNRSCEQRGGWNKRPQLSDLRESGTLEQDADVVITIFRPDYYDLEAYPDGKSTAGITELQVQKQRNGPVGMKKVMFSEEHMKFKNITNQSMNEAMQRAKQQKQSVDEDYPF